MIYTIKKKLQSIFKSLGYQLYYLIYGRIKGIISSDRNPNIEIEKVNLEKDLLYKIFKISKGRVYTDAVTDTAFIIENQIIEGPSFQHRDTVNVNCAKNIVLKKGTPKYLKKINGSVASLLTGGAGNHNYFHWMFDVLPRLEILNKSNIVQDIDYYLLPNINKKFQKDSLDLLEIDEDKRLSSLSYRHISANTIVTVDHPYVLKNDATNEIQNIPLWISQWLRKSFLINIKKNNQLPKKIYISRKDTSSDLRKVINESEVINLLKKNDYISVVLSELKLIDQINLFYNAESIVGLHGAGFANIVFCKSKTKILELKPYTAGDVIKNLSLNNDLNYQDISIKPSRHDYQNQYGHITIPISILEKKI